MSWVDFSWIFAGLLIDVWSMVHGCLIICSYLFVDEEWGFLQEGLKSALARYNAAEGLSDDAVSVVDIQHLS